MPCSKGATCSFHLAPCLVFPLVPDLTVAGEAPLPSKGKGWPTSLLFIPAMGLLFQASPCAQQPKTARKFGFLVEIIFEKGFDIAKDLGDIKTGLLRVISRAPMATPQPLG